MRCLDKIQFENIFATLTKPIWNIFNKNQSFESTHNNSLVNYFTFDLLKLQFVTAD